MTEKAQSQKHKPEDGWTKRFQDWLTSPAGRLLRYAVVLLIVLMAVVGSLNRWFELCETVTSAKEGITTTCSGPNLTSAGVFAAVLLVLLLLWPDLSEFSAFGVTVKRLVLDVKDKVIENGATALRIDSRTADTHSGIQQLQSLVAVGDRELGQRLDAITTSLGSLREQRYQTRSNEQPRPALNRWYPDDHETLNIMGRQLFGEPLIRERAHALRDLATDQDFGQLSVTADLSGYYIVPVGLLIERFRRVDGKGIDSRGDLIDGQRASDVLRLVERLILAYLDGRAVSLDEITEATAILWLIEDRLST